MKFRLLSAGWILLLVAMTTALTEQLNAQDETAPVITSPLLVNTNLNQPFSYPITTTGTQPISFSVTGLPLGLSLSNGTISGTPQQFGRFSITMNAINAFGIDTQVLVLTVSPDDAGQAPIFTSNSTLNITQGSPVNFVVTASGAAPINFTTSGLPAGLAFDGQTITGIPSTPGTFTSLITASNSGGTAVQTLTINVAPGFPTASTPPAITSPVTATGVTGQPFSYVITTEGTIPITLSASGLPIGLSLVGNTISGIPSTAGNFSVALTANNVAGTTIRQIGINIVDSGIFTPTAPFFTNALSTTGTVGTTFTFPLTASGQSPIIFTASPLPAGLTLIDSTISGVPLQAGTFPLTIAATNAAGIDVETFVITIQPSGVTPPTGVAPLFTSVTSATGFLNQPFVFTATAAGAGVISFSSTGLPQGLTMASNGVISGTPLQSGTFPVVLTATNIFGTQSQTLFLQILSSQGGPPVITTPLSINATLGQTFTLDLTAAGTTPITFAAANLPAGITLTGSTLSGTPLVAGSFPVTLSATNGLGTTTQTLVMNVSSVLPPAVTEPPVIISPIFVTGTVGSAFNFPLSATGAGPVTFSTTLLPPGLALVGSSITGIPQFAGNSQITVTATNAAGTVSQDLLISIITPGRILPAGITPIFSLGGTSSGVVGQSFLLPLSATGIGTVTFSTSGLPTGLVLSGDTIVGSPTIAGTFPVTVIAQNSFGSSAQTVLLNITETGASGFGVERLQVLLNSSRPGRDIIRLEGAVNLPAGTAGGQEATIDIGGVRRTFTLNANGIARSNGELIRLKNRRGEARHRLTINLRGDFSVLAQYLNATSSALPVQLTVGATTVQNQLVLTQTTRGNITRARFAGRD